MLKNADRVKESSTTTGTGAYSLGGAPAGFRTFVAGVGDANTCYYFATNGVDWEIGIGTVADLATDTLTRTTIFASSNAGAAVSWLAGTKTIACAPSAFATNPRTRKLTADHAISAIAGTKVAGLDLDLILPGTYEFEYFIFALSATLTVSPMFGINFTGTAAVKSFMLIYNDSGPLTAGTGTADDVGSSAGQPMSGMSHNAYSTTAPNLGATGGVATINSITPYLIKGVMIVTAVGTLEFWHGSETATSTTVKAGTCVKLTRMDD